MSSQDNCHNYNDRIKSDPNVLQSGESWLNILIEANRIYDLKHLLENYANPDIKNIHGTTPLHKAAHCRSEKIVDILLRFGACPNSVDNKYNTPLHISVETHNRKIAEMLLRKGAKPNKVNEYGESVLHLSVKQELVKMTQLFLNFRANTNLQDIDGNTPLHFCVKENMSSRDRNIARALRNAGAKIDISNKENITVLDLLKKYNISQYHIDPRE